MALSPLFTECKWKTRPFYCFISRFSQFQPSSICFSQATTAEENGATKEANVTDDSNKHECFAYTKNQSESLLATPHKWPDWHINKRSESVPDFKHIDTGKVSWVESTKTSAMVKSKLVSKGREVFVPPPSVEDLWKTFFADPSKWFDNRKVKRNKQIPDFSHKDTFEALWLGDKSVPTWVFTKLNDIQDEAFAPFPSMEELWNFFFTDSSKWIDHRKTKKSNKYPDFKHKYSGEALWIKSKNTPPWVISMLKNLRNEAFSPSESIEDLWIALFADPCKWIDYRKTKKSDVFPDFRHKKSEKVLWINNSKTPAWVLPQLPELQDEEFAPSPPIEECWKSFFADPSKWIDYRKMKKSNNCPDFVHKETTEGLWIDATETPFWLTRMVKELPDESVAPALTLENLWLTFFDDPSKWFDNRKTKKRSNHPDFKHIGSGEALWIKDNKTPAWVFSKLNDLWDEVVIPSKSMEDLWKALFADPLKWFDYRKIKKYKKMPDFRHKDTRESLWIRHKRTPSWVIPKLADLPQEAFASFIPVEDLWISLFVEQSQWLDFRKIKRMNSHPDFMHKDTTAALWIENTETPAWVRLMLQNLKSEAFSPVPSIEHLWKSLFDDPSKWWDNRKLKKSTNQPDFVNRNTHKALWIDDQRTPNWVLLKLSNLKFEAFARHNEVLAWYEDKWKAFFANPSKWFDNRTCKVNPKAPDFRHKDTKETLWIANKWSPNWVVPSLSKLQDKLQ